MNQILETNKKKYKLKKFFKIQFFISFILIIIVFIYALIENNIKNRENEFTKIANQNAKLNSMFRKNDLKNNNLNEEIDNIYFCTLKIEKINLEYFVYENYSEENLKQAATILDRFKNTLTNINYRLDDDTVSENDPNLAKDIEKNVKNVIH